jgi:hypothetical protein
MKQSGWLVTVATVAVAMAGSLQAQSGPEKASKGLKIQSEIVAVTGCLGQDGANWTLTSASPILAKAEAVVDLTPAKVKDTPAGTERYRLIGLMEVFNAAGRRGKKVLVKGLFIEDPKENRINLTSLLTLEETCK